MWSAGAYPRGLVGIQECAAQVEERAEDEVRDKESDPLAVVALGLEDDPQGILRDTHDDHERSERAQRVPIVGDSELAAPHERCSEPQALDHRRGDSEPHEREPG